MYSLFCIMGRLYKYDNKEYDFDKFKEGAIGSFDDWIKKYDISDKRKEKIKQAMYDLLLHMSDDEGSNANLLKIHFSTDYAKQKGLFGKSVEDSKHYKNATAFLLDQFNGMDTYVAPEPKAAAKTKLSKKSLGQAVVRELGNYTSYNDEQKRAQTSAALTRVLNGLNKPDTEYEFGDDGYTLLDYKNFLNDAITAANTNDNFVDDSIFWGQIGLSNPFKSSDNQQLVAALPDRLDTLINQNYPNLNDDLKSRLKSLLTKQALINAGLSEDSINYILNDTSAAAKPSTTVQPGATVKPEEGAKPVTNAVVYRPKSNFWNENKVRISNYIKNLNKEGYNPDDLKDVDKLVADMAKAFLAELAASKYTSFPKLQKTTQIVKGVEKTFWIVAKGDNYNYAYDPEGDKMVLIPVKRSYDPYHLKKNKRGGYLKLLKLNNYGRNIRNIE